MRISVFVIMRQIHSRQFQICGIDEYWREYWGTPYVKVSSRHYSSIYARTPKNVDKYSVFTYSRQFSENWRMCGSAFRKVLLFLINQYTRLKKEFIRKNCENLKSVCVISIYDFIYSNCLFLAFCYQNGVLP